MAYLGSREDPLRGTGSNLMFFFPYTRYILGARARVAGEGAGEGHKWADSALTPSGPILPTGVQASASQVHNPSPGDVVCVLHSVEATGCSTLDVGDVIVKHLCV